jgi:DNA-directed RNA polymerase I subunit RPA12
MTHGKSKHGPNPNPRWGTITHSISLRCIFKYNPLRPLGFVPPVLYPTTPNHVPSRHPALLYRLRRLARQSRTQSTKSRMPALPYAESKYVSPRSSGNDINMLTTHPQDKWPPSSRTISKPDAFSSALRAKRGHVQALDHSHVETWATTSEACPVCNSSATLFRELQLRGADEGSTVFFRCSNCAHKYVSATLPKQHRGFEFADDFQVEIEQLSKSNDVRGWVPATPTYHSTAVRGTE